MTARRVRRNDENADAYEAPERQDQPEVALDWTEQDVGSGSPQSETTSLKGGLNIQGGPSGRTQGKQNFEEREDLGGQSSEQRVGETIEEGNQARKEEGKRRRPGSV